MMKATLFLSDPPYGIDIVKVDGTTKKGRTHGKAKNAIFETKEYAPIIGDDTTETAEKNYEIIKDLSENQIIFGGNYFTDFLRPSRCWLVWDKENAGSFADVELAGTSFDKVAKLYMSKEQIKREINRVKVAIAKTGSPYLKRDYEKHLKKLQKQLKTTGCAI